MGISESKFANVPQGKDTKILFQQEGTLEEYDVLFEIWSWEGVLANSFVFVNDEIADLTDGDIEALVKTSSLWKGSNDLKVTRPASGFTFVTFNVDSSDAVDHLSLGSYPDAKD